MFTLIDYARSSVVIAGLYSDGTLPWANYREVYDVIDTRAHWIWTSNPGREGMSELGTDTRVYCRASIPLTCSDYQGITILQSHA